MNGIEFVGRKKELSRMQDLYHRRTASMVVVKGRWRIGKTRLIEEFGKGKTFLRFVGLAPTDGVSAQHQRDEFARLLNQQTGLPEIKTQDWGQLFALLAGKVLSGRVILLFDEISWMAGGDPTFLSKLKNSWELSLNKNPKLILILCGSISSWIDKNILSSTGYFGRISQKVTLNELSLPRCNQLLEEVGFKRSVYEKFMLLSLTGGVPWYIELIDSNKSAEQNIKSLCFEKDGMLVDEHRFIFHDLFGSRGSIYEKITQFLANKKVEYAALAKGIGYTSSGTLTQYLNELIEAGYVSRDYSWSLKTGKQSSLCLYRLSDHYLRFYYKYMKPVLSLIQKGQYEDVPMRSLPNWAGIMGLQFEALVLNNRRLVQQFLKIEPENVVADGGYYQRKTKNQQGCQIDYLIQTRVNTLFLCEIRFSQNELNSKVIQEVQEKIKSLAMPRNHVCIPVLIHVNGVSDALVDSNYFYKVIDFADALQDVEPLAQA